MILFQLINSTTIESNSSTNNTYNSLSKNMASHSIHALYYSSGLDYIHHISFKVLLFTFQSRRQKFSSFRLSVCMCIGFGKRLDKMSRFGRCSRDKCLMFLVKS